MDIVGIISNVVGGVIGGNGTGVAMKDKSIGAIGNTIAGAVGGVAGGYITQALDLINKMGLSDMTAGAIATKGGIGLVCGAILTAIVSFIKNKISQ